MNDLMDNIVKIRELILKKPPTGVHFGNVNRVINNMMHLRETAEGDSTSSPLVMSSALFKYGQLIVALLNAGWTVVDSDGRMVHQDDDTKTAMTAHAALLCSIAVAGGQ